jgi:hypothetical protein
MTENPPPVADDGEDDGDDTSTGEDAHADADAPTGEDAHADADAPTGEDAHADADAPTGEDAPVGADASDADRVDRDGDRRGRRPAEGEDEQAELTGYGDGASEGGEEDTRVAAATAGGETASDERPVAGPVEEASAYGGVDPRSTAVNTDPESRGDDGPTSTEPSTAGGSEDGGPSPGVPDESNLPGDDEVPPDVQKYERFTKMDGAQYERVNEFLRERTYVTAREWAIARLCSDFRTETGVEMTKIGENLPELVPFMTDTYTPQAVNQARASFEEKVRKAGATFLYGAMCDFFTAEELDDVMYESTEVAKFLLEVEGVDLSVDEELDAEERISSVMREVRSASEELRDE